MKLTIRQMITAALIAAIYVVLCYIFKPISFSVIQVRISEALTVLPAVSPIGIWGVSLGCLLSNLLIGGLGVFDIVFGTLATVIAAILTYLLRKKPYLAPLPPVIVNAVVIAWVLKVSGVAEGDSWIVCALYIGTGQLISCYALGLPFLLFLRKNKEKLLPSGWL